MSATPPLPQPTTWGHNYVDVAAMPWEETPTPGSRRKVLYRNEFVGKGQELICHLTEALYLRQVATVGFDASVTPDVATP